MKRIIFALFVMLIMGSCGDDSPATPDVDKPGNNNPDDEKGKIEQYEETFHHAVDYLNSLDSFSDTTAIVAELGKLDGVRNITKEGELLVVTLSNGLDFDVDLRQGSRSEWECENPYTDERITEMADSIGEALGWTDSEEDGFVPTDDVLDSSSKTSRAATSSAGRVRILNKKNVLVWNPYPDLAKEDKQTVRKIVKYKKDKNGNRVGNEVRYATDFSPESFSAFSKYDLVWVGSHGNLRGDVLLPCSWLSDDEFDEYKALIGKGVRYSYRTVWENGKKYWEYISFSLGKAFFDKYMPDLSNTIIWTCFCYSGLPKGSFYQACKAKNAASYFGSPQVCTAKDIYTIFGWFYPALDKGRSANYAFSANNAWSYKCHTKPGGDTFDYNRCINNYVSYVAPRTRQVKSDIYGTVARSDESYDYVAGVQVHYDLDEGSTPQSDGSKVGAVLINRSTGDTRYMNYITDDESKIVGGNHVVRDFGIWLNNLEHDAEYSVTGYVQTSQGTIYADESYVFTAKDSTPTYKISNAEELRDFLNSTGRRDNHYFANKVNAEIVADIDLGEYIWPDDKKEYGNFWGTINGNGHTVKMLITNNSNPLYYTLMGNIINLNFDCNCTLELQKYESVLLANGNSGTISKCNFTFNFLPSSVDTYFLGVVGRNDGLIEDCCVVAKGDVGEFRAYCNNNEGDIVRCRTYADNLNVSLYYGLVDCNIKNIVDCSAGGRVILKYGNIHEWYGHLDGEYPGCAGICKENNGNFESSVGNIKDCINEMDVLIQLNAPDFSASNSQSFLAYTIAGICCTNFGAIVENCINRGRLEINNIRSDADFLSSPYYWFGTIGNIAGICHYNTYSSTQDGTRIADGIIKSCVNEGMIDSNGHQTGGICNINMGIVEDCTNNAMLKCTVPLYRLEAGYILNGRQCLHYSCSGSENERCVNIGQIVSSRLHQGEERNNKRQGSLSYPKSNKPFCLYDGDLKKDYSAQ